MSRVNRVFALLDFLRAHEATSVANIARELGVSRRTILRDLDSLRDQGWPIRTDPGPGGGVVLDRDRGLSAVHLSSDEIASLWLAAQLSASASPLPWGTAARSALDKAFASLPPARARPLRQLVKRVLVGRPATARIREELGRAPPGLVDAFERAFAQQVCLAFDYIDRRNNATHRTVEPHGLLVEPPAWYVLARDTATGAARMFRMDRIRCPRVLPQRGFVPDFDGLWRQAQAQWAAERAKHLLRKLG
jgi:predicted DNA-binding transcriptional regulator YafY